MFSVEGLTVIITGAARGNGRALAEGFLAGGATVHAVDLLGEVEGLKGPRSHPIVCDLTEQGAASRIVRQCVSSGGKIDVLVNNAGISISSADPYDDDVWQKTLAVNLTAAFRLSRAAAREMAKHRRGSIINVTSLGASMGFPDNPSYQAAKAGLSQLTRAMARDYGAYNVRVNNLCPGYVRTSMTQASFDDAQRRAQRSARTLLGRWGEPADLVGPCLFLASEASAYVTGTDLNVDGGWMANGL
jgi:NAD(P)-dependent dehydrogenase (short-subunit alcohol dehydrogenase family)